MSKTPACFNKAIGVVFQNCSIYNPSGILFSHEKNDTVSLGVR